ncbi:hypothetical protein FACS1894190_02620 [Spirochaetia bacterium]|nr:hypothetical protein FACS1894190_02620 [Spirochaetia bacterium]
MTVTVPSGGHKGKTGKYRYDRPTFIKGGMNDIKRVEQQVKTVQYEKDRKKHI